MPHEVQKAMEEWRKADDEARALEALMSRAWDLFLEHKGPAVEPALAHEAAQARKNANELLDKVVRQLAEAARRK